MGGQTERPNRAAKHGLSGSLLVFSTFLNAYLVNAYTRAYMYMYLCVYVLVYTCVCIRTSLSVFWTASAGLNAYTHYTVEIKSSYSVLSNAPKRYWQGDAKNLLWPTPSFSFLIVDHICIHFFRGWGIKNDLHSDGLNAGTPYYHLTKLTTN